MQTEVQTNSAYLLIYHLIQENLLGGSGHMVRLIILEHIMVLIPFMRQPTVQLETMLILMMEECFRLYRGQIMAVQQIFRIRPGFKILIGTIKTKT